ncbi:MAG TPA: hypothetical protein VNP03_23805 [Pseudonocardia sp.]|nr:hypothetical protein [Pseudonocardia sp.]
MSSPAALDHASLFEQAWSAPGNTAVELPPVDVNQALAEHYELDRELVFTRDMLWDMEVRKAVDPDVYITSVVTPGSVRKWPVEPADDFVRISEQRLWLQPERRGLVLEQVHIDRSRHSVYFLGTAELTSPAGEVVRAGAGQPLFHVEHTAAGTEQRPVNRWRIVHLTDTPDQPLVDHFARFGTRPGLRDFIEQYIRRDLGYALTRKG